MPELRNCPGCKRPNAAHRRTCLYCGHEMPNPTAAPKQRKRDVPRNLDAVFRRAMSRGNTSELAQVLEDIDEVEVAAPQPEEPTEDSPTDPPGALAQKAPQQKTLEQLAEEAGVELGDWEEDPQGALARVNATRATLQQLARRLEQVPPPAELVLPPFRQAAALFVQTGEGLEQGEIAQALQIDLATARMLSLSKHPRVALRGNDRDKLEALAERWRADLARAAVVFEEADLRAQPRPRVALELPAEGDWITAAAALWLDFEGPRVERPTPRLAPRLVVPGEVVVKRYRLKRDKRGNRELDPSSERRIAVVDLHGPQGTVRVVEGLTGIRGWGPEGSSHRQELKHLTDRLGDEADDLLAKRICQPTRKPEETADGWAEAAGWPAWEEHSRAARLLLLVEGPHAPDPAGV